MSIKSIRPSEINPSHLSGEQRKEALEKLRQYFDRLDAKRAPVSDQEAEEIIQRGSALDTSEL